MQAPKRSVVLAARLNDIEDLVVSNVRNGAHSWDYHGLTGEEVSAVQQGLLTWYDRHQRKLPWRHKIPDNPQMPELAQRGYEVLVSESMLQQTQVATVIPYYNKWMERWPTFTALANANLEELNQCWTGLGYYSRAKRLHLAAQMVVDQFNGMLPSEPSELEKHIPGVGRYTAGAIASIAFNRRAPVVDGNVIRVFSRLRAIGGDVSKKAVVDLIWNIADALVHDDRAGDFNQALMDLGATVCVPKKPLCGQCPISAACLAFKESKHRMSKKRPLEREKQCDVCGPIQGDEPIPYPIKQKKASKQNKTSILFIIEGNRNPDGLRKYLLTKRPDQGLLANMWVFPCLDIEDGGANGAPTQQSKTEFLSRFNANASRCRAIGSFTHLYTHISQTYQVEYCSCETASDTITDDEHRWVTKAQLENEAIPTGIRKAFSLFEKSTKAASRSIASYMKPRK